MEMIPVAVFENAAPAPAPVVEPTFDEKVAGAVEVVKTLLRNGKRLLAACSFGKDSSVMVSLTLRAMEELKAEGFDLPEFQVMTADTMMENPVVHAYAKQEVRSLRAYADAKGLPVRIWVSSPNLSENWLVALIGGRTVASLPGNSAKCQQSMKKAPLDRVKRQIRALIKNEMGKAFTDETMVLLIGTRRDESAVRGRNMADRGESAFEPVNTAKEGERPTYVLSPLADFTTMDIFTYLGRVTNGHIQTYSDYQTLTEVYRDSAGECMVNIFFRDGSVEKKTSCGSRGCWSCLRVADDRSMENMLNEESGKYRFMQPLNDFRNYLKARHYDPKARNWISRSINEETGGIVIAPNAYSPELCLELLRYALTIDVEEAEWAAANNKPPRFQLLGMREILAIDMLWGRYAYHRPLTALNEYREIFERGRRYRIPTDYTESVRDDLDVSKRIEVPFVDGEFHGMFEGLRSIAEATAGAESVIKKNGVYYTNVNETNEFDIDPEGAELFFDFELDRALEYYGPHSEVYPSNVVHMLARYGVVSFKKGGQSKWDKMLRIGNQLYRHGLIDILTNPDALIAKLSQHVVPEYAKVKAPSSPDLAPSDDADAEVLPAPAPAGFEMEANGQLLLAI